MLKWVLRKDGENIKKPSVQDLHREKRIVLGKDQDPQSVLIGERAI